MFSKEKDCVSDETVWKSASLTTGMSQRQNFWGLRGTFQPVLGWRRGILCALHRGPKTGPKPDESGLWPRVLYLSGQEVLASFLPVIVKVQLLLKNTFLTPRRAASNYLMKVCFSWSHSPHTCIFLPCCPSWCACGSWLCVWGMCARL